MMIVIPGDIIIPITDSLVCIKWGLILVDIGVGDYEELGTGVMKIKY